MLHVQIHWLCLLNSTSENLASGSCICVPFRFHDDVELNEDEFHNFTVETKDIENGLKEYTYTLTIPTGRHKDTGQYKFIASNKFGQDECSVSALQLNVHHVSITRIFQLWSMNRFMSFL
jgi:hypothetical protein